ncbi:MAG: putative basic amino acid antiporter YfcC [Ignavibacteria bacterium]|nr:putative basic amino acid antiporter YfcC [Ignavibacteria bacterium]
MPKLIKSIKIPHVFTLLTVVVFICSILTYIIKSGDYQRETKQIGALTRTVVIPGTYKEIPKNYSLEGVVIGREVEGEASPVSLVDFLSAIPRGMEEAADIIFFIFIIGGVFGILQKTGTIMAFVQKLLDSFGDTANLLVIILMTSVAVGASTLGMGEEFIPLIPIFLIVSKKLGYDRVFGLGIVWLAAESGFAAATTNPFTVNIAQGIAEVPLNSGIGFRVIFFSIAMAITIFYLLRYGAKVKKDHSKSLMPDDDFSLSDFSFEKVVFRKEHIFILIAGAGLFAFIIYAVQVFGWWINEMAGGFLLIGFSAVIISRMSLNNAAKAFIKGLEDMVVAALVVGFARGVQVVLQDGQILDTIIHFAAFHLQQYHNFVAAGGMLAFQTFLNFFIPSGSGQAAVTMPLMAPLSDLIGITRQTAVFAFTCGDGFSNMIIPTSGTLMAVLAIAKVPYTKWLRFALPLFAMLFLLSVIFLIIAVVIHY